jgi:hypothetical protein
MTKTQAKKWEQVINSILDPKRIPKYDHLDPSCCTYCEKHRFFPRVGWRGMGISQTEELRIYSYIGPVPYRTPRQQVAVIARVLEAHGWEVVEAERSSRV